MSYCCILANNILLLEIFKCVLIYVVAMLPKKCLVKLWLDTEVTQTHGNKWAIITDAADTKKINVKTRNTEQKQPLA